MVVPKVEEEKLVFDKRLSSVVPGKIKGENKTYELKGIDLAMKLHYIKALYFFTNTDSISEQNTTRSNSNNNSNNNGFINILEIKKPMFDWLISYFMACGRIRLSSEETGDRPSIKLNDAGIRIVEARSTKTVDEWLTIENFPRSNDQLVYDNALGPELSFSPLICIQVTWFRCGGISMGLSWAHILGDGFSASEFMNMLGQYMQGHLPQPKTLVLEDHPQSIYPSLDPAHKPISVKRVNPVDNHWVLPTNSKIGTHTFHLSSEQLSQLHSKVHTNKIEMNEIISNTIQFFEVITAIMWKSIAKIRKDLDTKCVTLCRPKSTKRQHVTPYNGQVLGTVKADFSIRGANLLQLVRLVDENAIDESYMVEELVNKEMGNFDFYVYGANLTFVDMEKADVYGFEVKGKFPKFASFAIDGVGDKGVVLVLPGPKGKNNGGNGSKLIVVLLPENEIELLKNELKEIWCVE